ESVQQDELQSGTISEADLNPELLTRLLI
ncbi:uncharacterized, partial [Tachysurus ichikawai]